MPDSRPQLRLNKKGGGGVEIENKGNRTIPIRQTSWRGGARPSHATDEGRFTIFFLPKPLIIIDLHNLKETKPENTISGSS